MSPNKMHELRELLLTTYKDKVYYNSQDNTVYYQTGVDLEALTKATKGYKVFIQLILF